MSVKQLKTCTEGHQFYKSSDCEACPVCEQASKPGSGFLSLISAPARRALSTKNINSLTDLASHKKAEIAALHGMGPSGIKILENALQQEGLSFKHN